MDRGEIGSLVGTVDVNLLTAGEACETVFEADTDHGKVVYLYEGEVTVEMLMADEFDADEAQNVVPENAVKPFASDTVSFDAESTTYSYSFSHLPTGNYTVAFSCSAVGDDSEEFDSIVIANPTEQQHSVVIEANVETTADFTEI